MSYSFTEKKRIRKSFATRPSVLEVPSLLETQLRSYEAFLQADVKPESRKNVGLQSAFTSIFPITSHNGYGDLEMHYGLVGIILSLAFLVYLIYLSARLLKGLKKEKGVLSLILICAFLIYFAFEPRFFTLDEASTVFLLLSFVFPMMDDEEKDLRTLEGKSEARMYRITKDLKVKGA